MEYHPVGDTQLRDFPLRRGAAVAVPHDPEDRFGVLAGVYREGVQHQVQPLSKVVQPPHEAKDEAVVRSALRPLRAGHVHPVRLQDRFVGREDGLEPVHFAGADAVDRRGVPQQRPFEEGEIDLLPPPPFLHRPGIVGAVGSEHVPQSRPVQGRGGAGEQWHPAAVQVEDGTVGVQRAQCPHESGIEREGVPVFPE